MRTSIGTGIVLIAAGAILAFAVQAPAKVEEYVDVLDVGLILIWSGILVLVMQAWLYGPRTRRARPTARQSSTHEDPWAESDVHRPGYAGETQRLPTVRGTDRKR